MRGSFVATLLRMRKRAEERTGAAAAAARSHPVLAQLVRARLFQPLAQAFRILLRSLRSEVAALLEDHLLDEDLRPRAQRQGDRVARAAVDGEARIAPGQVDPGEERVLAEVVDHDALDARL